MPRPPLPRDFAKIRALRWRLLQAAGSPAVWFAAYVLWLTAFPMSGALLAPGTRLIWFALPHALALLALGRWLTIARLYRWLPWAVLGTALLTALYSYILHFSSEAGTALMLLLGIFSAPFSIWVGVWLGAARWPLAAAALGLCGGNLAAALLAQLPGDAALKLVWLACLFPGALWLRAAPPTRTEGDEAAATDNAAQGKLWQLLPFVALFQIVSGLMYGYLWQADHATVVWPGVELLAYILGVLLVVRHLRRRTLACALLAVGLSIAAFVTHHAATEPWGRYLGLLLMLTATGTVDLLLLANVLAQTNRLQAYGYGVGVMVLGIVLGEALVVSLSETQLSVALLALVLLNLATVALFLPRQRSLTPAAESRIILTAADLVTDLPQAPLTFQPPPVAILAVSKLGAQLSAQELRVLEAALGDATYKEIGQMLGISESSVKTYMQRIYRKLGVYRRSQLADRVRQVEQQATRVTLTGMS